MTTTNHPVRSPRQLAELLSDRGIEQFEIDTDQYPAVAVISDDKLVTLIPFNVFEPLDFMGDIRRILDWHTQAVDKGLNANDYGKLLRARSKLAQANEHLGGLKAQVEADYLEAGYERRRKRDNLILIYRGSMAVSVAEARARTETEAYDVRHVAALKLKVEINTLYDTVGQVLNAMSGERHTLDKELQYAGIASA